MGKERTLGKAALLVLVLSIPGDTGKANNSHSLNGYQDSSAQTLIIDDSGTNSTETVVEERGFLDRVKTALVNEANNIREQRKREEAGYENKIDEELNRNRINVLVRVRGQTHEPPSIEKAYIASETILSLNYKDNKLSAVSFTHDVRAPEIERYKNYSRPIKIYKAYEDGGFDLMRQVYENATGLAIDYQVNFDESVLKDLIDDVFAGIEVDVPKDFRVAPIYYQDVKYAARSFTAGRMKMDGLTVLQFIKSVPSSRDKDLEHNFRKHLVFREIVTILNENKGDVSFDLRLLRFLKAKLDSGELAYDSESIDIKGLLFNNFGVFLSGLLKPGSSSSEIPEFDKGIYVVDPAHGDGGVMWVRAQARINQSIRQEIDSGYYERLRAGGGDPYAFEIPIGGNPYAEDLVNGYWKSVRQLVKSRLMN